MLVEHHGTSFSDSEADTEPLPIIAEATELANRDHTRLRTAGRFAGKFALYQVAAVGLGAAIAHGGIIASSAIDNAEAAFTFNEQNNEVSTIASHIADLPMRVDCDTDALGGTIVQDGIEYTTRGAVRPLILFPQPVAIPVMTIREDLCDDITEFTPTVDPAALSTDAYYDYTHDVLKYADALSVVLHESEHIKQEFDEAAATCYAYQKLPGALEELGIDEAIALSTAKRLAEGTNDGYTDEYLSDECRPGGSLDLAISDVYITPPEVTQLNTLG